MYQVENFGTFLKVRDTARKIAVTQENQLNFARGFLATVVTSYLPFAKKPPVRPLKHELAEYLGELAAGMEPEMAAYLIGTTYTVMLPEEFRSSYGVFYTPPALTERLLTLAEQAGVNWETARVLDPACGGGAFLTPVARRMVAALSHLSSKKRLAHIETHLQGFEIDPFSAWVSQSFVEALLLPDIKAAKRPLGSLVEVRNSLNLPEDRYGNYDLVIGNPPYGRIKLSAEERGKWARGLYGHANLYGLFADLATRLAGRGGIIAYVTPTSFLGGQYFQALRHVLANEAPPTAIEFIADREGVFADVLQETMLSIYKKQTRRRQIAVSYLSVKETGAFTVRRNGRYTLPDDGQEPWLLPRIPGRSVLVEACRQHQYRLRDLGYTVSTGPLVWNRHKGKLHKKRITGSVPVIWAECVNSTGNGEFTFKATGRNHAPWFKPGSKDGANIVRTASVLLQRTTSLEQSRRLIAAELPQDFIDKHGGAVAVENHLNMVRPMTGIKPVVSARVIAALLNSDVLDDVFRCINGSTAVSAYELESMPLPSPENIVKLEKIIARGASREVIEHEIRGMYSDVREIAAA